jgi:hypothetical protein
MTLKPSLNTLLSAPPKKSARCKSLFVTQLTAGELLSQLLVRKLVKRRHETFPLTGLALFRAYHLLLNEPIGFGRTLYVEDAIFLSRERMIVDEKFF